MRYGNNFWLLGAVLVSLAVLGAAVLLPMLQVIFSTVLLTGQQLGIAAGFSLAVPLIGGVLGRKPKK